MFSTDEQQAIIWHKELDDYVRQVFFINEGKAVLATTSSGKAYAFAKNGINRLFSRQLHKGAIITGSVSQQHGLLATGGEDGVLLLTRIETGDVIYKYEAKGKWIEHAAFSADGNYIAFAIEKKVIILTATGDVYDTVERSSNSISAISWHENSDILCIGFFGGVYLYNISNMELYQFLPWKNAVVSLTMSPDQRFVCSGTQDHQVHIWPIPYRVDSDLSMQGFPNKVKHLSWHYAGSLLATNSGQYIVVWDFSGKGPANTQPDTLKGHFLNVTAIAFQYNNDILVSGDQGGLILFFCPTMSSNTDFVVNIQQEITTLTWCPDDRYVLAGTAGGELFMIECPLEIEHDLHNR